MSEHPPGPVAAIIPAAGLSTRFGRNKLAEPLGGVPVFVRTVRAFLALPPVDIAAIVIAYAPDSNQHDVPFSDAFDDSRLIWTPGGPTRAHSVRAALSAVPTGIEWVAIHDAARPLVSADLIGRCIAHAHLHGNASPAMPVKLTIKQATGPLPAMVERTLPRAVLWEMQTPQVMCRDDLLNAFETSSVPRDHITDDAQLLELAGHSVWLVPGDEGNLKITTPADLQLAELLLADSDASDSAPSDSTPRDSTPPG